MTRVLLVRHALCDAVGTAIAGRAPGIPLNDAGRTQAAALARRLERDSITAIYSSPLERAVETADLIAAPHGLPVATVDALIELDFGDWTGRTLASLEGDERWRAFNDRRSVTRVPGGELMIEAAARAAGEVLRIVERHDTGTAAIVTHADIVRALLCHFLGMPLDHLLRLRIDPASVTELRFHATWTELASLNVT